MSQIGSRVRQLRLRLGLTQVAFADKIGVKGGVISAWENGSASVPYGRVLIISEAYNVNEKWLQEGRGEMFIRRPEASNSPKRQQTAEYLCELIGKMPKLVQDELLDLLGEIVGHFNDSEVGPEDYSNGMNGDRRCKISSAEDDFDEIDGDWDEDPEAGEWAEDEEDSYRKYRRADVAGAIEESADEHDDDEEEEEYAYGDEEYEEEHEGNEEYEDDEEFDYDFDDYEEEEEMPPPPQTKRGRGRPRKNP